RHVAEDAQARLAVDEIEDDPPLRGWQNANLPSPVESLRQLDQESYELLLKDSISPLPLHKTLVLLESMNRYRDERYYRHQLLALAKALISSISNLQFGPEVGLGPPKPDAPAIAIWLDGLRSMAADLRLLSDLPGAPARVHCADARRILQVMEPRSIDAVITS